MEYHLSAPETLAPAILDCYDVSDSYPQLQDCLVSPRGCIDGQLQFCKACLAQLVSEDRKAPPKFSIANHNWIGTLPDRFSVLSQAEVSLVSMGSYISKIVNVQGGIGKKLIGHSTVFLNSPGPPVTLLPIELENTNFNVVFGGSATDAQRNKIQRKHLIHYNRVYDFLRFLKEHNVLYR
jgi:hypothetical protein